MPVIRYFAYGSNLLTALLQYRCPSAVPLTIARAPAFTVEFGKLGRDQSGKASLVSVPRSETAAFGVVFELERSDLSDLDDWEGDGYRRVERFPVVCLRTGDTLTTDTYIAKHVQSDLKPHDWYLAVVLAGLREHCLDEAYTRRLRDTAFTEDPAVDRQTRQEALSALARAGIVDYRELLTRETR